MPRSFQAERDRMVEQQIARRGIAAPHVLRAMRTVPRERFVETRLASRAYDDAPLPIAAEQTISQPYIVAWMIAAAAVAPGDRVLEVGAGSGYAAAVLAQVAGSVHAIERHDRLTREARERLDGLAVANVHLRTGDGTLGWPEAAPFDAILVAAAGPEVPPPLKAQLRVGGRLVMPLDLGGEGSAQFLARVTRTGADAWAQESLGRVAFVPLIGRHAWAEDGAPH